MKKNLCALFCAALLLFCSGCNRGPAFVNPVLENPDYITFAFEDFSFSYPKSYTVTAKDGYLLYGSIDPEGKQAFGVTYEAATGNGKDSVNEAVVSKLCESIIENALPSYQSAAMSYDAVVSASDFSYTVDSLSYPTFGAEPGAKACYTVNFNNEAFSALKMSFCSVWVFDEETMYVLTFCDVTGAEVSDSFAGCLDYIFCA